MSGIDLINDLNALLDAMPAGIHQIAKWGDEYANAEKQYRMLVRQEILKAQSEGIPATLIKDLVRGIEEVADAKFKRDRAEAFYKAAQESVNVNKLKARLYDNQINREWGNNG